MWQKRFKTGSAVSVFPQKCADKQKSVHYYISGHLDKKAKLYVVPEWEMKYNKKYALCFV